MICKLCGKEVPDDALYCNGCGNSLRETLSPPPSQENDPSANEAPVSEAVPGDPAPEEAVFQSVTEQPAAVKPENPAEAVPAPEATPKIHSHMVLSIIMTVVFGNWILGIPAIVFARECELAAEKKQWDIALRFSGKALAFALIGVAVNLALWAFIALAVAVFSAFGPIYW